MDALKRHATPAPAWWNSLAGILGFSERQSRLFWSALSRSSDPRMRALVYRCDAHEQYLQGQRLDLLLDGRMLNDFLRSTWTPHTMVLALERLNKEGLLTRQQCKPLEERFLRRCSKFGGWTIPKEEGT